MTAAGGPRLRVLQSTPEPGPGTNPYIVQLHRALAAEGVEVVHFSWRRALLGRYDLLHTHWPEILVWGRDAPRALARQLLTLLLVLRLRLTGTPVVRTVHNLAPHEPVRGFRGRVLGWLQGRETWWVRLSATTPTPVPDRTSTIPLGHFRDWFAGAGTSSPRPGHVVVPGVVRAYKGLDTLVAALPLLQERVSAHVIGRAVDGEIAAGLERDAESLANLRVTLRHVDDDELVAAVTQAQLVVLPYRSLHNSAALLLGLSLDRPVLVPSGPTTEEIAAEVGHRWVLTADLATPESLAQALERALEVTASAPDGSPDLSRRDWSVAGRLHLQAYREAVRRRRGGSWA